MLGGGLGGVHVASMPMRGGAAASPLGAGMGAGMGVSMGSMGGGGRRCGGARGRVDTLAPGTAVALTDLTSQEERNGAVGVVQSYDEHRQRYVVALQDGTSLAVRATNMRQIVTDATVVGTSKDELNGKLVSAATYDRASKRYRCQGLKGDGTVVSLRPENVVLPTATRVTIDGIQSKPHLNGRVGAVANVDLEAGRYDVHLQGEAVRLRFGAVAAC